MSVISRKWLQIYWKILPSPFFSKRGLRTLPLWKRGSEGDFMKIIFMLICAEWPAWRFSNFSSGNPYAS